MGVVGNLLSQFLLLVLGSAHGFVVIILEGFHPLKLFGVDVIQGQPGNLISPFFALIDFCKQLPAICIAVVAPLFVFLILRESFLQVEGDLVFFLGSISGTCLYFVVERLGGGGEGGCLFSFRNEFSPSDSVALRSVV